MTGHINPIRIQRLSIMFYMRFQTNMRNYPDPILENCVRSIHTCQFLHDFQNSHFFTAYLFFLLYIEAFRSEPHSTIPHPFP